MEERRRLGDELVAARRCMDVLRPGGVGGGGTGEGGGGDAGDGNAGEGKEAGEGDRESPHLTVEDRLLEEKEAKAIASVLNAGPIATRDAAALFFLARRVQASAAFSGVNEAVLDAAAALYEDTEGGNGGGVGGEEEVGQVGGNTKRQNRTTPHPPSRKQLSNHIRQKLGISLTLRELERVARVVETERET